MAKAIELSEEAKGHLEGLRTFPKRLVVNAGRALDRRNELTVGHVQEKKLSKRGRKTLGVVTNRLRSSASRTPVRISGSRLTSSIGSNVVYARAHEFGFSGRVNVSSHQRKVPVFVFGRRARNAGESYTVRAHARNVKITARRMFGTGIKENERKYAEDLSDAVLATFRG